MGVPRKLFARALGTPTKTVIFNVGREYIFMSLTMNERKSVTTQIAKRYQHATKTQKGVILDEFCATTGYTRSYATYVLRNWQRKVIMTLHGVRSIYILGTPRAKHRQHRPRFYDDRVITALKLLWAIADGICGKRLVPFIRESLSILERFREIVVDKQTHQKLMTISAATIDRRLASERAKWNFQGQSTTKPGTLLKHQIPIRTFSQWDEQMPGFVEIDLVSHEGGFFEGENIYTLDVTDICTKWTETRAVKNKAQRWVFEALENIIDSVPFPVRGIDSDNGGEFINAHLQRYTIEHQITFTRSRPFRKNDSCFVEQKNYSVVRKTVGYYRYDTPEELDLLNHLYAHLRLYTNFFQPAMNLIEKVRVGSKVTKRYDIPTTPYHRVIRHPDTSSKQKALLTKQYNTLNPAQLKRTIVKLQDQLFAIASKKALNRKFLHHHTTVCANKNLNPYIKKRLAANYFK